MKVSTAATTADSTHACFFPGGLATATTVRPTVTRIKPSDPKASQSSRPRCCKARLLERDAVSVDVTSRAETAVSVRFPIIVRCRDRLDRSPGSCRIRPAAPDAPNAYARTAVMLTQGCSELPPGLGLRFAKSSRVAGTDHSWPASWRTTTADEAAESLDALATMDAALCACERRRPESNRCRRLCRPLRSHSATSP